MRPCLRPAALIALLLVAVATMTVDHAVARTCTLTGTAATCEDGRTGLCVGDAILWPDGTRCPLFRNPRVQIDTSGAVRIGPGVFVGSGTGRGNVPLDDPNGPYTSRRAFIDGVRSC
jgi:hypothetical protein